MLSDFSNDISGPELLTVSASSNSSKGERAPQSWMPDNPGMACDYIKAWIAVKWDWDLGVSTQPDGTDKTTELGTLEKFLAAC